MEDNLGRTNAVKSSVTVNLTVSTDRLHVALLSSLDSVSMLNHFFAVSEHCFHITMSILLMMNEIFLHITGISMGHPVVFRMHQYRIVKGLAEIQHRFQHLIFNFDDTKCFVHCFFRFSGHNCHCITYAPNSLVKNETVIGGRLREGLSCNTESVLRYILPCINCHNARYFHCCRCIDIFDQGVSIGASQNLHHQTVLMHNIIHKYRFSKEQLLRIFLRNTFSNCMVIFPITFKFLHASTPFRYLLHRHLLPDQEQHPLFCCSDNS